MKQNAGQIHWDFSNTVRLTGFQTKKDIVTEKTKEKTDVCSDFKCSVLLCIAYTRIHIPIFIKG